MYFYGGTWKYIHVYKYIYMLPTGILSFVGKAALSYLEQDVRPLFATLEPKLEAERR